MKKSIRMATIIVAGTAMLAGCGGGNGFKTTENGLQYKFEKQDPNGQQVQEGDVLVGDMTIKFDTVTLIDTKGEIQRLCQANPYWEIKVGEGLLMMHVGDIATFAMDADTIAKYMNPNQMPPYYMPGTGQKVYYRIDLRDIVTKDEYMLEQANAMAEIQKRQQNEPQIIADYIAQNNITEKPNAEGLYVIVKKKGTGAKVAMGREVAMHYTGRLLDGTVFDSSVEREPLTYKVGAMGLIRGWEDGVMGQPEGTKLQIIMPSALGYGSRGSAPAIPPYSPLVFDIEIVSVK